MKNLFKSEACGRVETASNAPRKIIQIVEDGNKSMELRVLRQYALELNGLVDGDQVAKIEHLISELREQLATLVVNIEDFPNTEWVELAQHDRT